MAEFGAFFLLFALFAVGAPLILYALARDERQRDANAVTDRASAERAARQDVDDRS